MKFKKDNFYSFVLLIILLSQIYIPSFKFNVLFQLLILIVLVFNEPLKISKHFFKTITPLVFIVLIGFIGFLVYSRNVSLAIKDFFHIIKPLIGIIIGYVFYKLINNKVLFYKTIIKVAFVSALIHIGIVFIFTDFLSFNISAIRRFTKDNFLELFSLFFFYYFAKKEALTLNLKYPKFYFYTILFSCILYFSRTMMVTTIILFFSLLGYTKITAKSIKIITVITLIFAGFYITLFNINIKRTGTGLEGVLYKIKNAPAEIFEAKINREDHRQLWDRWRAYEAKRAIALLNENPEQYLIGSGYGSQVNLKFKAPLDDNGKGMKYISELHNGYIYILYKLGLLGLFSYLFFLFSLYVKVYKNTTFETVFISATALFYTFTTLTITGIFNTNDTIIIILGALFGSYKLSEIKYD